MDTPRDLQNGKHRCLSKDRALALAAANAAARKMAPGGGKDGPRTSPPSASAVTSLRSEPTTILPPLAPRRQSRSYAPPVSSPLNPASGRSSIKSADSSASLETDSNGHGTSDASTPPSRPVEPGTASAPAKRRSTPLPPRRSLRPLGPRRSAPPGTLLPSPSQLSVTSSDMDREYSRYPVPRPRSLALRSDPSGSSEQTTWSTASTFADGTPTPFDEKTRSRNFLLHLLDDHLTDPAGLQYPLFNDEKEADDDMHLPGPDDDINFKPRWRDYMHRQGLTSIAGIAVVVVGLLCLFVVLPVLTHTGIATRGHEGSAQQNDAEYHVNDLTYPLLRNLRQGLIDPDTPSSAMTRSGVDGDELQLVFSDEFNVDNRSFYPGDDIYWTAPDIWYGATQDLEWYDPDAVTTSAGTLNLKLDQFANHGLQFRSGMLNSWNQLCFKGGALEVSVSLPGPAGTPGLWPGVWTMGNLGRPGYGASTEGVWPYTYNECDVGITPNQSSPDGISHLPGQRLPACTCPGQDHPTPGTGRGAPEIDVFEASVDQNNRIGVVTQSFQVAPFDVWYYPQYEFIEIPNYATTSVNTYTGGPFQQAVSGTTVLNNLWYDGGEYQRYAFEYTPGTSSGAITWFVGSDVAYKMLGASVGPNGNIGQRQISEEPMSIVLNLGISNAWTYIDWANLTFPTTMRIDYVRIYQKADSLSVTCDPDGYHTTGYINDHPLAYNDANLTHWDQTGYGWPKHQLNSAC
ncbi:MAG: hypothetical protein M1838_003960 [Thelocarpon superellum]|nr:MAG: hypothetical protein M1838_003960 [Thelocarpon superellum]